MDRPLQRIREFRNRPNPKVVVTVDMLSTGVDIPALEFIVFLRPVKSRILWEQMLGRGTRLCPDINKSKFVVFDCFDGTLIRYFKNVSSFDIEPPGRTPLTLPEVIENIWQNVDRDYHVRILAKRLLRIDKDMNADARTQFAAWIAGDLLHEVVALIENGAAGFDELVGVRGVRDVVDGEDEDFREMARDCLVFVGVFGDLLDDLAIAVRRGDVALHRARVELAFIFQLIERLLASVGVHALDGLAFVEENAVHAHVRFDGDRLVVHEEAVENGLLNGVTEYRRAKECGSVRRRSGRETDLDGIEVIERAAPARRPAERRSKTSPALPSNRQLSAHEFLAIS